MSQETLRHLSRLNAQFIENYVHNNVAAHDDLLHPEFSYVNGGGARVNRVDYLRAWATGFDAATIPYWDMRDEKIELHGEFAFVSAVDRYEEIVQGKREIGMAAYTDTYVLSHGIWKCIRAQITMVATANWPPDDTILRVYISGVLQQGHRMGVV